jgi:hypothetical protein
MEVHGAAKQAPDHAAVRARRVAMAVGSEAGEVTAHMKPASHAMARRRFLGGATSAALGLFAGRPARAQTGAEVRLVVSDADPGVPLAADFIGLSYESAVLVAGDYFAPDNRSVLGLIRSLGGNGVIRIGGNTSEHTVWRSQSGPAASGDFVISPASIDRLAAALRILGWKLIYGLNLARGTPEAAAAEAAYVARAAGPNLLAFQIGNEPDGFGRWAAERPPTYDATAFLAEWGTFHAAVHARVPDARFAGPDVAAASDWVPAFAEARPEGLVLLTSHYYAEGPAGAPDVTLAKLLRADDQAVPMLGKVASYARSYQLPCRIVEANSVYNEGQAGVSDTLGAALWGLEFMFEAAAAGIAGVNFHGGVHNLHAEVDKAYTPIARGPAGRYRARPLYYGMLMFARAARGALVPARLASSSSDLKAFAARAPDGSLRVCLINKDPGRGARVRVDPRRAFTAASVVRLSGPAIDATAGVTLGGSSVDEFGAWAPALREVVSPAGGEFTVDVSPASAALVILGD